MRLTRCVTPVVRQCYVKSGAKSHFCSMSGSLSSWISVSGSNGDAMYTIFNTVCVSGKDSLDFCVSGSYLMQYMTS